MTRKRRNTTTKGKIRKKRSDTHIRTIEKKYGKDYGVRSDMHIGTYLNKNGYGSLTELLNGGWS